LWLQVSHFIVFPDSINMADILICQDTWRGNSKFAYSIITSLAQFVLPFTVVIILYVSILFKLRSRPQVGINIPRASLWQRQQVSC
jgi:hypothetical protein